MFNPIETARKSLAGKVIVATCVLILFGAAFFWYINSRMEKKALMDSALVYVASLSDIVRESLWNDMLQFERIRIQKTIESISAVPSVEKIQISNWNGDVVFSSKSMETGKERGKDSLFSGQDLPPEKLAQRKMSGWWFTYQDSDNHDVLAYMQPILNASECFTAACHIHKEEDKGLGLLRTDISLQFINEVIKQQALNNSFYMLGFGILVIIILSFLVWRLVLHPLRGISKGIARVSSGDLSHKLAIESDDELGELAASFNRMIEELNSSRGRLEKWSRSLAEEVARKTREIRETQERLIQAEKMGALGRLTADIAHQIRNPLTVLGGIVRRLEKFSTTDKQREYARIVVTEATRLESILNEVLIYSKADSHFLNKISLSEIIEDASRLFVELCRERTITLETELDPDILLHLDKGQIRKVIDNLMDNAIAAMPKGGVLSIQTLLNHFNRVKYISVCVADTGPGVPEDKLVRIFEPFYTTKNIDKGTGLGLSICKKIIEAHGGFISAANRPEGGLVVCLNFPFQTDEDNARKQCWEFMHCGRNKDSLNRCPACPHYGRSCWTVAGTLCAGKVQGTFAQKHNNCKECAFYQYVNPEEEGD